MREGVNWAFLMGRALEEGLASFLYLHCKNLDLLDLMPEYARELLSRIYSETLLLNTHMLKAVRELDQPLRERGISVIVFKGISLLGDVYQDAGLRLMEDIDLIARPEHVRELKRMLECNGFVPDKLYRNTYKRGIITLDIHTDFLSAHRIKNRRDAMNIKLRDVWERAHPFEEGLTHVLRLSMYDSIIALSSHLLKHRFSRWLWFVDIRESIEGSGSAFSWSEFVEYSRKVRAERIVLYALLLSKHFLGMDIPAHVLSELGKSRLSVVEKHILRLRLAHAQADSLVDLLWLYQIPGPGKKIRFILENAFPKKEVMNQIFPSSSGNCFTLLRRFADVVAFVLSDVFSAMKITFKGGLPRL
ncbi:MAG TPA: nucleotidyltransferase family protein [Desulfatiglandales bacterium]|nr:nucleotidyltransferase family protein [Desulfatiglandales bacterium]